MAKYILKDVVIIRLLLIILLVLYHSFAIYNGAWQMPEGIHDVKSYWWIASFSYSFMLEAFVFVSGYVFGFQVREKYHGEIGADSCVLKKAKRLLVPSIVFSILYFLCFNVGKEISWGGLVYNIINGEGHMWFLPMLFWCFVALFIVERLHIPSRIVFILAMVASIFSLLTLPLRISSAAYYFIFFYAGYYVMRNRVNISVAINEKSIVVLGVLYVCTFVFSKVFLNTGHALAFAQTSTLHKVIYHLIFRICKLMYSAFGVAEIYILTNYLLKRNAITVTTRMIKLSSYCFGVYIFQQFILMPLVHNPEMVSLLGTYWLPWCAFLLALFGSILLTWIIRLTRVGRVLIG